MDEVIDPTSWLLPEDPWYLSFLDRIRDVGMGIMDIRLFDTLKGHHSLGRLGVTLDLGRQFDRIMEFSHSQPAGASSDILKEFQQRNYLEILPHDIKVQILYWMPDVATLLALASASVGYEVPFQSASKAITTRVTLRQLTANRFDIYHPMLGIMHYLGYPQSLAPNETMWFDALKSLRELVLGRRHSLEIEHCLMLLHFGHDDYYLSGILTKCIHLLRTSRF